MKNKKNIFLIILVILMVFIGLSMIYLSSNVNALFKYNDRFYFVKRQGIFAIIGLIMMFVISRINILKYKKYNKIILIVCLLLMVLVLVPGIGLLKNGSRSWFSIGSIAIQPSEFLKLALILNIAGYLSKKHAIRSFTKDLLYPSLLSMVSFLLILLQPDFGSGVVMISSLVIIVIVAGAPMKYFIRLVILAISGLSLLVMAAPYRLSRIMSFLNPWQDPLGSGFQIIQSLFAIGPGGLFGVGINNSVQKHFYLPEPQTDFIFSIMAEELGFIGCLFIIGIYVLIIYEGYKIATRCKDKYSAYVAIGLISLFAIQVLINLGVVVGLFPVTGITLPLMSYGGSSLVVMLSSIGLLLSISNQD